MSTVSFVRTGGAMVAYRRRFFRVGLGPSLNLARLTLTAGPSSTFPEDSALRKEKATRLGAIFEAAVVLPEHTRVFGEVKYQYRYVGGIDMGPLSVREHGREVVVVPATRLPFDHAVLSLGVGFRFPSGGRRAAARASVGASETPAP